MAVTLGELAVRLGCELQGDPATVVDSVATLANAHPRAISFLANPRYRAQLTDTRAAAVIVDARAAAGCQVAALIAANPYATFARIAQILYPRRAETPGIHPSAVIDPTARIDPSAHIAPLAVIGARASVAARAVVGPHCVVGEDSSIGADTVLVARVTLCAGVKLGERDIMHPGVVLGSDGFGFAADRGAFIKVPQVGAVRIGNDVEIGSNTTIDRGAIEDTVIGDGVKLDNQIQIGHAVRIGAHTAIAGCTGISGSTQIGARCQIGGAVAINGHLTIADDVYISGASSITHSITTPGVYSSCIPAEDMRTWRKLVARFKRLGAVWERLAALERATGMSGHEQQGEEDE